MKLRPWLPFVALLAVAVACGGSNGGDPSRDGLDPADASGGDDDGTTPDAIDWDTPDGGPLPDGADPDGASTDDGATGGDTSPDASTDTTPDSVDPGGSFFASAELTITILGPAAGRTASALGNVTGLAGAVFGEYESITWTNQTNGASGTATGAPFWKSGPVQLANGDNLLRVEARKGAEVATDRITVTYNPGFRWDRPLEARPSALFVGDTYPIYVTASMAFYTNYNPNAVTGTEVDANGQAVGSPFSLYDDGGASAGSNSCDTIAGDGIYCGVAKPNTSAPRVAHLRVMAHVTAGAASYTAYSEVLDLPILARISQADCTAIQQLTSTVHAQFEQAFQATGDRIAARDQIITSLQGNPLVAQVGPASGNGSGLWTVYRNGILGGFTFPAAGTRGAPADEVQALDTLVSPLGGPTIGSKRVSLLSPSSADFPGTDETADFAARMSANQCPPFEIDGGAPQVGAAASIKRFTTLYQSGLVGVVTHGDALFGGLAQGVREGFGWESDEAREVLWSGEVPACANLQQSARSCTINQGQDPDGVCPAGQTCIGMSNNGNSVDGWCYDTVQVDLATGRLAFGKTLGVLPSFVEAHAPSPYPNSLVYLGACRSLFNGTMASAFFAAGAKAILGFTGDVTSAFAFEQGRAFAEKLLVDRALTGAAFEAGHTDPANPTTAFELFGATNLDVNNSDIVNPSWELGNLTGWTTAGDGRVISKLGVTAPVAGKFMGVVSTGMGYTLQVGSMKQKFCIPTDANRLQFYWNYCSEEFQEFCGTQYQDPFTAALKGNAGNLTMVDVTVDSLCPSGACMGCGADYVGVYESDIDFDQGDAWCTRWQKSKTNVSALAPQAKPVELQFFVTDEGDSIYDTVILIDDVRLFTE